MHKEEVIRSISNFLFVILVLAGIVVVLSFCFRPATLMEKSRDAHRVEDLKTLTNAVNLFLADNKNFEHLATGKIYSSVNGDTDTAGQGWLPLDFQSVSSGAPLAKLPQDPLNDNIYHYRFGVDVVNKTYEFDCVIEAGANQIKMQEDGGNNPGRYEVGTDLNILK